MSALAAAQAAFSRAAQRSRGFALALAAAEPWLVLPFLIAGLIAPRLLAPALGVAALFRLAHWRAFGRLTIRTPGDPLIFALVLLIPVSLWVTPLPDVTRMQAQWLLTAIAVFYVIVNWATTLRRERRLVFALVGVAALAAFAAPVAVAWVIDIKLTFIPAAVYESLPLLVRRPMHPNVLAGVLVTVFPVPLALLMFGGAGMTRRERLVALAAAAGVATILVLTKSRGALLAGMAAALVLALLRWRRARLIIPLAALAAALAVWRVGPDALTERLLATGTTVGVPGRLELWSRAIYMIQDFPFTGIGMGTFEAVSNELYPYFLLGPNADAPHAHNLFLQVAVDLGIFGFAAWLGLLAVAVAGAWSVYRVGRRVGDGWAAGLGAGLLAAQVALAAHGLLDAAVWGAHSGIVVWVLWGVCMSALNLRDGGD